MDAFSLYKVMGGGSDLEGCFAVAFCLRLLFLLCVLFSPLFSLAQKSRQAVESYSSLFLYDMTTRGKNLHFISWNLKNANQVIKRNKVMTHLKQLRGDIFFLRETHLCASEVNRLKRPWIGDVFHSKFPVRARGAAILIHKNVPFELSNSTEDLNGRFVIISGRLCVIMCKFISSFFSSLPKVDENNNSNALHLYSASQ